MSAFEAGEIEVFHGDFLEGLYLRDAFRFEEWLLFERQRLRGQYQSGMEQQLEMHRRQGDAAAVVISAQQLLKLDNLREDWHRVSMEAYARLGKRATALEQFEQCRLVLRKEWDVDPAPETVALAESILRNPFSGIGTPEALKYLVPGVWLRRLTQEHRLVYLVRDERIDFLQARYHYGKA